MKTKLPKAISRVSVVAILALTLGETRVFGQREGERKRRL
jgi:hypothetical protein